MKPNRFAGHVRASMLAAILAASAATSAQADPRPIPRDQIPLTTVGSSMSLSSAIAPRLRAEALAPLSPLAPEISRVPTLRPRIVVEEMPDLRWDHVRGSSRWTRAAMRALDAHGNRLLDTVPRDIEQWCPAYPDAGRWERKAFWAGLLSTLSKHESTYRATAVGGGGLWYGLVQILPATARGYGCQARSGDALKDGELNMACAVRILNTTVPRDNVVARGMRGVAADWGPFHSTRKREDMRRWLVRQPFCNGLFQSTRPVARPDWVGTPRGTAEEVPLFVSWELDKQFHDAGRSWPATPAEIDG
ncbi:MAG: transglycosylase SLT domain-containing protein [Jannaschia sp.]